MSIDALPEDVQKRLEGTEIIINKYIRFDNMKKLGIVFGPNDLTTEEYEDFCVIMEAFK